MRAFQRGQPFMEVEAAAWIPGGDDLDEMRDDIAQMAKDGHPIPVFSEMHLYPRLGKDDARFVLAVVDEYQHIMRVLGPQQVKELLETDAPVDDTAADSRPIPGTHHLRP